MGAAKPQTWVRVPEFFPCLSISISDYLLRTGYLETEIFGNCNKTPLGETLGGLFDSKEVQFPVVSWEVLGDKGIYGGLGSSAHGA